MSSEKRLFPGQRLSLGNPEFCVFGCSKEPCVSREIFQEIASRENEYFTSLATLSIDPSVIVQLRLGKAVKPIGTVMSLRAKRSNLPKFGDCHPRSAGLTLLATTELAPA